MRVSKIVNAEADAQYHSIVEDSISSAAAASTFHNQLPLHLMTLIRYQLWKSVGDLSLLSQK